MLNGLTDLREQFQSFAKWQVLLVAVFRNLHAPDELHHKIGAAAVCRSRVENFGDIRMVHHRDRLSLRFEAGDHLAGIHVPDINGGQRCQPCSSKRWLDEHRP